MSNLTDRQLLREYTGSHSESAFTELVERHVDLVYSAALRMVRDTHLAEDVSQGVFMALAQNAPQLIDRPVLSGWLHRTAQNIAAQTVRTDVRRRVREQESAAMNEALSTESDATWELIVPHLDVALGELNEPDRDVLMLRYFEKKSAREMGGILGISEEAAQRRVSRAVERLRELLGNRGVAIGASGLTIALSVNAVQAAPVGLVPTISAAAFVGMAISTHTTIAVAKTIAITTLQKTLVAATAALLGGAGIYEARQATQLRGQVQALRQQQTPLLEQIQQLQRERDEATNRLTALSWQVANLERNPAELLKLRGEVGRLRGERADLASTSWQAKVNFLKQKLEQMPDKKIPELQFITDKEWAKAVWDADLNTEDGVREALSKVRDEAESKFIGEMMQAAARKYLVAHNQTLPASLSELKPYFDVPVTDEVLQRYQLLQTGKPDYDATLVRFAGPYADTEYDSKHEMSINGAGGSRFNLVNEAVWSAVNAFIADNHGQLPLNGSQILPYLRRSVEPVTIEKYLERFVAEHRSPDLVALAPSLAAYAAAHNDEGPKKPSDLFPYVTTPEQRAALEKLTKMQNSSSQ